jgi:hypothetical protein
MASRSDVRAPLSGFTKCGPIGNRGPGLIRINRKRTPPSRTRRSLLANRTKGIHKGKGLSVKKTILSIALAMVAPFAWAQTSSTSTTTTTTTDGGGTITEYTPGSVITLKETSGPRHYKFGKTVTYVTKSGRTLDEETVRTRIKVGIPVHVHYTGEGDNVLVDRVVLDED